MTTVENVHSGKPGIYCARPTQFGNPFAIGKDGNRAQVIAKYREYFYNKLEADTKFKEAVLKLKGHVLLCFCYPLDCHCNIIADYLNEN